MSLVLLFTAATAVQAGTESKKAPRIVLWGDEGVDWQRLIWELRAGGSHDNLDRPEGVAFAKLKRLGIAAYPHLIRHIDNEDPLLTRVAVAVLNKLTGRRSSLPNETTKLTIKVQWESWFRQEYPGDDGRPLFEGVSEEAVSLRTLLPLLLCDHDSDEVEKLIDKLSHESVEIRSIADSALSTCVGRHGDLLRDALKEEKRGEGKLRLMNILLHANLLEAAVRKVEADPAILERFLKILSGTPAVHKEIRKQLERALDRISTR